LNLLQFPSLNHRCALTGGVREAECRALLRDFFVRQRTAANAELKSSEVSESDFGLS
jgi:hypothetical protein